MYEIGKTLIFGYLFYNIYVIGKTLIFGYLFYKMWKSERFLSVFKYSVIIIALAILSK